MGEINYIFHPLVVDRYKSYIVPKVLGTSNKLFWDEDKTQMEYQCQKRQY